MLLRFTWVTPALAAALALGACQDTTEPVALEARGGGRGNTECRGVPSDDEFFTVLPLTGTFDNVVVPRGATCFLLGSTVRGNVKALEDSRLFMVEDVVGGNVEGDKARAVNVIFSTVRGNIRIIEAHDTEFLSAFVLGTVLPKGNIQIEKGRFPLGDWNVVETTLEKGNIKVEQNGSTAPFSQVSFNNVAGNVQVFKNTGPSTTKFVDGNTIGGNLQCKENEEPFVGGPNVVAGKTEGQCSSARDMSALRSSRSRPDLRESPWQKKAK